MSTIAVPLVREVTQPVRSRMEMVFAEDFHFLEEHLLSRKLVARTKIPQALEEYRKFMCLVSTGIRQLPMPSRVVDQVWHAHILFTQEYTEFCNRIIGTYVHHQPTTTSVVKQGVREFGEIYESYFGPQPKLWVSAYADCGSCVSCGAFKPPLPTDNTSDSDISDVTS